MRTQDEWNVLIQSRFSGIRDHPLHPLPHFIGRLVRKGDRQDIARIDVPLADQVRDPAGDHPRLAAARAGQDQERPVAVQDSLALGRIEIL